MSLSQALSTATTGLRVAQTGMALVASNVANAETPGYVRKSLVQESTAGSGASSGVRVAAIVRQFEAYVQRQLRVETSGGAYANLRAQFYDRLQNLYGAPGSANSLESVFNRFTNAVQQLATSPDAAAARSAALSSAQVLAQQLNGMTEDIQSLRADAERGIADAVLVANEAMAQIASINGQLAGMQSGDAAAAALQDQRDVYIDRLAELMDIKVVNGEQNQVNIFTGSGVQLVGAQAGRLTFNPQGTMSAATTWSADPAENSLGTLMLVSASGAATDLIASKAVRAGEIAAYVDMRDNVLVQAQAQLDALAAAMSSALSDRTVEGDPVTSGLQQGFELDTAGLRPGNTITLSYTDNGQPRTVTIVRVDDPAALPLDNGFTIDPGDTVLGVNFAGGTASVVSQLNAHFGGKIQFSNAGSVLRALDDGAASMTDIGSFTSRQTVTALDGGSAELPFFTDGNSPFTGAVTATGSQRVGLAGRITVNSALIADPSRLVAFAAGVSAGDPTRPDFIHQRLTGTAMLFSPDSGIGSAGTPFSGSLPGFLRQVLSQQGGAAEAAASLAQGQEVVVNALKQRVAEQSGVNIDQEMANLLTLQNAYAANARVMTVVRDLLEVLMNII